MTDRSHPVADELRICSELDTLLLDELTDLLNEKTSADTDETQWLQSSLAVLCDTVDREMAVEDSGGYLATVLEEFPNWDTRVEAMRARRESLHERLKALRSELESSASEKPLRRRWRDQFRAWIEEYSQHKRRERDLLQDAFVTDIGVGD